MCAVCVCVCVCGVFCASVAVYEGLLGCRRGELRMLLNWHRLSVL